MKYRKFYLLVICMLSIQVAHSQVTNGGFENWAIDGTTGALTPTGWQAPLVNTAPCVIQAPGYTGSYSAKFVCNSNGFGGYDGGIMQIDNMPINAIPVNLTGNWKVNVASPSGDYFNIWAEVYDASQNVLASMSLTPGFGVSVPSWTAFTEPFGVTASGTPSTMTISLEMSQLVDDPNSNAFLDDLTLEFNTSTNDFSNILTQLIVSNSMNTDATNIQFVVTRKTDLRFTISDLAGRILWEKPEMNYMFGMTTLDMTKDLPAGIYILQAISENGIRSVKFVK